MTTTESPRSSTISAKDALTEEWIAYHGESKTPLSAASVESFYEDSVQMQYDLNEWHQTPDRQARTKVIAEVASTINSGAGPTIVLDVGAGGGHDLKALQQRFPNVVAAAVEPNQAMQQALELDGIPTVSYVEQVNADVQVDLALCIDVFEHVTQPDVLLENIISHIKVGGLFIENVGLDYDNPLHLAESCNFAPGRLLDRHGFDLVLEAPGLRAWHRLALAGANAPYAILCAYRSLGLETAKGLINLTKAGWRFNIHGGDALISRVRSIAVSDWLRETDSDVFLMIDDDIHFQMSDAIKVIELARKTKSIASGAYSTRGGKHLASRLLTGGITFGPNTKPQEIKYAATGFIAAHREVCEAIVARMPFTRSGKGHGFWPMFQPLVIEDEGHAEYLSEDWAFCAQARSLGYKIWIDPSVMLIHYGQHAYTVYDIENAKEVDEPNG